MIKSDKTAKIEITITRAHLKEICFRQYNLNKDCKFLSERHLPFVVAWNCYFIKEDNYDNFTYM